MIVLQVDCVYNYHQCMLSLRSNPTLPTRGALGLHHPCCRCIALGPRPIKQTLLQPQMAWLSQAPSACNIQPLLQLSAGQKLGSPEIRYPPPHPSNTSLPLIKHNRHAAAAQLLPQSQILRTVRHQA